MKFKCVGSDSLLSEQSVCDCKCEAKHLKEDACNLSLRVEYEDLVRHLNSEVDGICTMHIGTISIFKH